MEHSVRSSALARTSDPEVMPLESRPSLGSPIEQLVRTHFSFVWRVARRFGLGPEDAEDATQRVMLIAADRLGDLLPGKERAFLFRTAMHVARNFARSRMRRREEIRDCVDTDSNSDGDAPGNPEQLLAERRDRERLDWILAQMPEDLRSAFVAFEIEGLSLSEIALSFAIPQGTVSSRLRRARECFLRLSVRQKGATL